MAKQVKCGKCGSAQIQVLGQRRKSFSVGKAIVGGALTGGLGTLAGFTGGKSKIDAFCTSCGYRFKIK